MTCAGGTSPFVVEAVARYPQLRGAIYDLPAVLPAVRPLVDERVALLAARTGSPRDALAARVQLLPGDLFDEKQPLPPADVYALCRVLHDWDPAKVRCVHFV
jgi:acetylserotonin N-methyltransferase